MKRYQNFNPKRRIAKARPFSMHVLTRLIAEVTYTGNPEHKRSPGDFGLTPPAQPRRGKSLCDGALIFKRSEALRYLREGLRRGAFSERNSCGWPKNVWAVTDSGMPLEAQIDGEGSYHGYPMPPEDPMSSAIVKFWQENE